MEQYSEVLTTIAVGYMTTAEEILGGSRKRSVSEARAMFVRYLCHVEKLNWGEIGSVINRTHSTVLYLYKLSSDLLATYRRARAVWSVVTRAD